MSGAPVPPAKSPAPSHDDGLFDAIALIECYFKEDSEGVAVVARNADQTALIGALVTIIGSEWCAECIHDGSFRSWALAAGQDGGS